MTFPFRVAAAVVLLGILAGCGSLDKYEYVSTPHLPTTVSLMNTANDQVFWKMDIPVGQKLKLDFDRPGDIDFIKLGKTPANELKWKLQPVGGGETKSGAEALDGMPFIVKINYRTPGELPGEMAQMPGALNVDQPQAAQVAPVNVIQVQPAAVSPSPQPIEPVIVSAPQPIETTTTTYQQPSPEPITVTVTPMPQTEPVPVAEYTQAAPPAPATTQWEQPQPVDEPVTTTTAAMPIVAPVSQPEPQPLVTIETPAAPAPSGVDNKWITMVDETPAIDAAASTPAPMPEPVTPAPAEPTAATAAAPEAIDLDALFGTPEPAAATPAASPKPVASETQVIQLQPIRSTVTVTPAPQPVPATTTTTTVLPPIDNVYHAPPQPDVDVPTPTVEKPVVKVESSERISAPATPPTFEARPLNAPPPLRFDAPATDSVEPQLTPQSTVPAAAEPLAVGGDADGYRRIPVNIQTQLLDQFDAQNVSILVEGVPRDAALSAGRNNGSGIWTLRGDQVTALNIKLPARYNEDVQLLVIATAPTATGDTTSSIANMTIRVPPLATLPVEATNPWR